jgi:hypothetical protein
MLVYAALDCRRLVDVGQCDSGSMTLHVCPIEMGLPEGFVARISEGFTTAWALRKERIHAHRSYRWLCCTCEMIDDTQVPFCGVLVGRQIWTTIIADETQIFDELPV